MERELSWSEKTQLESGNREGRNQETEVTLALHRAMLTRGHAHKVKSHRSWLSVADHANILQLAAISLAVSGGVQ